MSTLERPNNGWSIPTSSVIDLNKTRFLLSNQNQGNYISVSDSSLNASSLLPSIKRHCSDSRVTGERSSHPTLSSFMVSPRQGPEALLPMFPPMVTIPSMSLQYHHQYQPVGQHSHEQFTSVPSPTTFRENQPPTGISAPLADFSGVQLPDTRDNALSALGTDFAPTLSGTQVADSLPLPHPRPGKRSRTQFSACQACRSRRVKCDLKDVRQEWMSLSPRPLVAEQPKPCESLTRESSHPPDDVAEIKKVDSKQVSYPEGSDHKYGPSVPPHHIPGRNGVPLIDPSTGEFYRERGVIPSGENKTGKLGETWRDIRMLKKDELSCTNCYNRRTDCIDEYQERRERMRLVVSVRGRERGAWKKSKSIPSNSSTTESQMGSQTSETTGISPDSATTSNGHQFDRALAAHASWPPSIPSRCPPHQNETNHMADTPREPSIWQAGSQPSIPTHDRVSLEPSRPTHLAYPSLEYGPPRAGMRPHSAGPIYRPRD